MADQAPEIKVAFTAEDGGLNAAIAALISKMQEVKNQQTQVTEKAGAMESALKRAFSAGAAVLVAEKIFSFAKGVYEANVQIGLMAQKIGISSGLMASMNQAARQSGVSIGQMQVAVGRLSTNIILFQQGSTKAAEAMRALGLTQASFAGLNTDKKILLMVDALGKVENPALRFATAVALAGRGGGALVPVILQLAAAQEFLKSSGQFITPEMQARLDASKVSFGKLGGEINGAVTQLEDKMLPFLTDMADLLTTSVEGAKHLASAIGDFLSQYGGSELLKFLSEGRPGAALAAVRAGWLQGTAVDDPAAARAKLADQIATGKAALELLKATQAADAQKLHSSLETFKAIANATAEHVKDQLAIFKAGNNAEAEANQAKYKLGLESSQAYFAERIRLAKAANQAERDDIKGQGAALADEHTRRIDALREERDQVDALHTKAAGVLGQEITELEGAAVVKPKLAANADDRIADEAVARADKLLKGAFEVPLPTADSPVTAGQEKEAETKIKERRAARDKEEIEYRARLASLDSALAVEGINAEKDRDHARDAGLAKKKQSESEIAGIKTETAVKDIENIKELIGFQADLLRLKGKTIEAELLIIDADAPGRRVKLAQAGAAPAGIDAQVKAVTDALKLQANFKEGQKNIGEIEIDAANRKSEIESRLSTTVGGQIELRKALIDSEGVEIAALEEKARLLRSIAAESGNEDDIRAAQTATANVDKLTAAWRLSKDQLLQFRVQAVGAIKNDLVGFLGQGIDQVHTLRQAFGQLAQSVIQSIQQIVAQLLVQIAFEKILAAIKKSSSGDGNDAAIGGNVGGAVGGILNLLSSAAATGATGGFVRGPGTSTSDSIPAWLSDGEFVVRASAVQQIGVPALMAINRGIHVPAIASVHGPRFADGGLVTGAGTGSDGAHITMGIGLDEGLVLKHLSSKAAGRVILQHIGANPKAANAGLQGRR